MACVQPTGDRKQQLPSLCSVFHMLLSHWPLVGRSGNLQPSLGKYILTCLLLFQFMFFSHLCREQHVRPLPISQHPGSVQQCGPGYKQWQCEPCLVQAQSSEDLFGESVLHLSRGSRD